MSGEEKTSPTQPSGGNANGLPEGRLASPEKAAELEKILQGKPALPQPAAGAAAKTSATSDCVVGFNESNYLSQLPYWYPGYALAPQYYNQPCGPGNIYFYESTYNGGKGGPEGWFWLNPESGNFCRDAGGGYRNLRPVNGTCQERDPLTVRRVLNPVAPGDWMGISYVGTTHSHTFNLDQIHILPAGGLPGSVGGPMQIWYKDVFGAWRGGDYNPGWPTFNFGSGAREVLMSSKAGSTNLWYLDDLSIRVL